MISDAAENFFKAFLKGINFSRPTCVTEVHSISGFFVHTLVDGISVSSELWEKGGWEQRGVGIIK